MKKILILTILFLTGCATGRDEVELTTLLSYERNTDIFINNELAGVSHTQVKLPYKGIKNVVITGKKKGCKSTELRAQYDFDYWMLLNPFNVLYVPDKYFNWDWWKPSQSKILYNVTPICN